nr:hypothetical protein [Rhizobium chutanense]
MRFTSPFRRPLNVDDRKSLILIRHDTGTRLEIVRLAADEAWLTHVLRPDGDPGSDDAALLQELLVITDG